MKKEKDRSHLGIEDRVEIATGLAERRTATEIASRIGCAKTTVSREVKGHFSVGKEGGVRAKLQRLRKVDYVELGIIHLMVINSLLFFLCLLLLPEFLITHLADMFFSFYEWCGFLLFNLHPASAAFFVLL